jgi:hypothetical protein
MVALETPFLSYYDSAKYLSNIKLCRRDGYDYDGYG